MSEMVAKIGNAKEAARHVDPTEKNVTDWTIRRWRLEEGLPYIQIGRRVLYNFASIDRWLAEREAVNGQQEPEQYGVLRKIK